MNDLISVIIPVYKVEPYLDACIHSVVAQTHRNLEILLVDDGSPDNCPRMCDEWARKEPRIRTIHKENGGLSDARNAGIDAATGQYIAFVDSDDYIQPDMLEKLLAALLHTDSDIAACGILSCSGATQHPWGCHDLTGTPEKILSLLYADTAYPVSALNKLYRRSCWTTLRFPLNKTCEDAFTTCQLVHQANRIVMIPEALYCYRIRPDSIMTSTFSPRKMDEEEAWRFNCQFVKQYYPALRKNAFDFYLQRVNVLIHTMTPQDRVNFPKQYQMLRRILTKHFWYILLGSRLRWKQRIRLGLDIITL